MSGELIYENDRTRVTRDRVAGVVRKELRGPDAGRRLFQELSILRRLAGVAGVPQLAPGFDEPGAIHLRDEDGASLVSVLAAGPVDVERLLGYAVGLAEIVAVIHHQGVMHRDISPANVLVCGPTLRIMLIDYDLASVFALERPVFTHHTEIEGTLAYLAPEQTGRTGWPLDQRADLYGLGATLYELATGTPPFGDADPLELVRDHLVRVPTPPCEVNRAVPAALSAIISHLLEKQPDRRYQGAEGLLYDLRRLQREPAGESGALFVPGERDFPPRLAAPSHPVGREPEIQALGKALTEAMAGRCRLVLVSGPAGVGKTALIDELRPLTTAAGGWFVSGKFDQYRQDAGSDAVRQALRGVGRMLLAEPEAELAALRPRLREAVGANAGLVAAVLPEFRGLLDGSAEVDLSDPTATQVRLQQGALEVLRTLGCPERPLVVFLDDLQWAGTVPVAFVDAVLADERLQGVLVVAAYREAEVDQTHPLSALLGRWSQLPVPPPHLRLTNLALDDVGVLLADMLRMPPAETAQLASTIRANTGGNPFDTVEFINALRREGLLTPSGHGWSWDSDAVRRHVGLGDVVALLSTGIAALPGPARDLLATMACLGGEVAWDILQATAGPVDASPDAARTAVQALLAPVLEDGLLVMDRGGAGSVRFRHDRIQEAVYLGLSPEDRRARHVAVARRLAPVDGCGVAAAEQYLAAAEVLADPAECRTVVGLFREAARHARLLANYAVAERFLAAAVDLSGRAGVADTRLRAELDVEWHATLFILGRFDDADRVYARIERDCTDELLRAEADWVQVSCLLTRGRPGDAVQLGLEAIAALGYPAPGTDELPAAIDRGIDGLQAWAVSGSAEADLRRGENTDARINAVARIMGRMIPAAYFSGMPVMAWLMTTAAQLWAEHGPSAALVPPVAHAAFVTIPLRRDYRTGPAVVRRVLTVSEALDHEPETSLARILYALSAGLWTEPLEDNVREARRAREGLVRGGDLQNAGHTFYASVSEAIDCAPTLDECLAEIEEGLAFTTRSGNDHTAAWIVGYRQGVRALRGVTNGPGRLDDPSFDGAAHLATLGQNPTALGNYHLMGALVALVYGDPAELDRHLAAAIPLMPVYEACQSTNFAHLLQALSLAGRIGRAAPEARDGLLAEFAHYRGWIADRAAEGPGNYVHLRCLLDAELAWATGDFERAVRQFDAAQHEVETRQRPWQRAFIAERRGRFFLAQGLEHVGRAALRDARKHYQQWGARGKVDHLDREFPFLQAVAAEAATAASRTVDRRHSSSISSQAIDMLAALRASQAISSETNLVRLRERVCEVLCAMTGATAAHLLLRESATGQWYLPTDDGTGLPVAQAAASGLVPLGVFRYVERTGESLLVDDASRDDRFAGDPYLRGLSQCAVLAVPIVTRGEPSAMLLLENRNSRGAFGANRLDTVMLIAGQLSVSLDNAVLYAELERKVAERTEELSAANDRLEYLAVTDALTGLANRRHLTDVLDAEWRRSLRTSEPVAVAVVDIDFFKQYNDRYGHLAGDECLRKVAGALTDSMRASDLVARYGGEEFVIVLPGTDVDAALHAVERARAAVEGLGEPLEGSGHRVVTVSAGVASTAAVPTRTAEQLIKVADAGLYEAKREGRNRVRASGWD